MDHRPGTQLYELTKTDYDYMNIHEIVIDFIFDGSIWRKIIISKDNSKLGDVQAKSYLATNEFDSSGRGIINTDHYGWALCNGANGTPNLEERFIAGKGSNPNSDYATIGNTGGAESVSLTIAQMAAHDHEFNDPGHNHTNGNYDSILQENGQGTPDGTDPANPTGTEPNITSSRPMSSSPYRYYNK